MYPDNPEETQGIIGSMNMGYNYIRHCQESNSQPVPSQAGADTTRPQWLYLGYYDQLFDFTWIFNCTDPYFNRLFVFFINLYCATVTCL